MAQADSRFEIGDNWVLSGGAAASWSQDFESEERVGSTGNTEARWRNERWAARFAYSWTQDDFRDEAGFITRTDFHRFFAKFDHYYRSERNGLRFMSPGINASIRTVPGTMEIFEGHAETNNFWDFGQRTSLFYWANYLFEEYESVDFHYGRGGFSLWSSYSPYLAPNIDVSFGQSIIRDEDFWPADEPVVGGETNVGFGLSSRPLSQWDMSASLRLRRLSREVFADALSTARVTRFQTTYTFTTALNLRFIFEHQHPDAIVSFDSLLSYIPSPGTVFFLGYRDVERIDDGLHLESRGAFLKLSYLWAL